MLSFLNVASGLEIHVFRDGRRQILGELASLTAKIVSADRCNVTALILRKVMLRVLLRKSYGDEVVSEL